MNTSQTPQPDEASIADWIAFACEANGLPTFARCVHVQFAPRLRSRAGEARYRPSSFTGVIRLGSHPWSQSSTSERRETVVHETCHLLVAHCHGAHAKPHGPAWRAAMRACGLSPKIHLEREGIVKSGLRNVAGCPEEPPCRLPKSQAGERYRCRGCNLVVGGGPVGCLAAAPD